MGGPCIVWRCFPTPSVRDRGLYCHCRRSFYSAVSLLSLQAQLLFCSVVTVIAGAAFILECLYCHCRRSFYSAVVSLSLQAQLLFLSVFTVIAESCEIKK